MDSGIHIALKAEEVVNIFGLPVTNTMLMSWLVMAVLITVGYFVGGKLTKIPSRLQTLFEVLFGFLADYFEEVLENKTLARRLFPLITTLFLFILLGNLFGLLPGIGSITVDPHAYAEREHGESVPGDPLFMAPTGAEAAKNEKEAHHDISLFHPMSTDLNVTLAFAVIAFVVIEVVGVMQLGFFSYLKKFFNFRSVIGFFVGIIELISEFARLISFSFRLFGNMFAGKTLILVAMFFMPYLLPIPLMLYEVGVGFIQASIFALLTLFFVKQAVAHAH